MLGQVLGPSLEARGFEVIRHGHASKSNVEINVDVSSFSALDEAVSLVKPDLIVNLVALTNVDQCDKDPNQSYKLNTKPVENLVRLQELSNFHIVHISTDHNYDGDNDSESSENDIIIRNMYGFSKYAGDLAARQGASTVLRTNFFGKSEHPSRQSFTDWLTRCFANGESVKGFSDVYFSPLSMTTLTKIIGECVLRPQNGIFNLGSHAGCSKFDFARKWATALGYSSSLVERSRVEELNLSPRPKNMKMNVRLFEKTFQIKLPSLEEELVQEAKNYG